MVATKNVSATSPEEKYLKDRIKYEYQFLFTLLNIEIIESWLRFITLGYKQKRYNYRKALKPLNIVNCLIFNASRRPSNMLSKIVLSQSNLDLSAKSILQNIIKAPVFKSGFELAKHHLKGGRHTEAKSLLKDLTNKPNCDWRVFYRSCYFLTVIAKIENDKLSFNHYKQLLDIANPQFPIAITEGVEWVFKAN